MNNYLVRPLFSKEASLIRLNSIVASPILISEAKFNNIYKLRSNLFPMVCTQSREQILSINLVGLLHNTVHSQIVWHYSL